MSLQAGGKIEGVIATLVRNDIFLTNVKQQVSIVKSSPYFPKKGELCMKRRLFSLFLALTLVVGMLPAPAFAQETESTQATQAPTEASTPTEAPRAEPTQAPTEAPTEAPAAEPTPAPTEALAPETTVAPAPTEAPTEPAPTEDEAVAAVQAMIDALPDVSHMSESYLDALEAAYSAFDALSETQQAQITGVEKLEALFNWVNSQVSTLADDVMEISGEKTWNNQTFTTPVKLTGETTLTLVGDNKIECEKPLDLNGHKLTIQGNGSLELVGSNNDGNYYNSGTIYDSTWTGTSYTGGGMVIESGTVIARADVYNAVAVRYLYMDGGKLEAYGARAGIVTTDLQIKDGSLYATGNSKCGINMYSAPRAVSVNGLNILVSNEPNAQDANMEDGTTKQIEDSEKKTVAIGKFSTSPSISVQPQQGYLYEATAKTATFALSGRNVDLSALNLEWTGSHTGLEASADGKTLTVTTDKTVQAGTYRLKVSAGEASRTAVVTVSGPPICIYDRPVDTISTDPEAGEVHVSAYLTKGHTGSIDFQWKQEDGTPIEGYTGENVPLYDLVELGMLTQDESKPWLQSIRIYCTLSYDGYNLDTDTVTVGLNSCTHEKVNHEGICAQCGQKKGDGDALLVREDGLYFLIANAEQDEADAGHFMYSGGNFYLTGDVPNKTVNVSYNDVGGKNVTLDLQGHTMKSLQMGNFPYGTFTLKNGTLRVIDTVASGKLILENIHYKDPIISAQFDLTVQGENTRFELPVVFHGTTHLRGGLFEQGLDSTCADWALELLDDGFAFYNSNGEVVDATDYTELVGREIHVASHTCDYRRYGKCDCGRSCDHQGTTDENGYCTNCGTFVYPFAIGEKLYTGLEAALTAAQDGDTVTLRGDYDMQGATVEITKSITLELNGHTLSGWPYAPILTILAPDVTIQNGTVKNTDTSKSSPAVEVGTLHTTGAKLTVKNAIFEGSESHGTPRNYGLSIFAGNTAQAENGTFTGGIFVNGSLTLSGGKADHIYVGTGVTYASLLAKGYAYQSGGVLVKLADMNDSTAVQIVKCTHPDGLTATDECPYCGMTCGHKNINQTTGLCPECGYQMAASLTVDGKTTFFDTFPNAAAAANGKTGALLTLLKDEVVQDSISSSFGGGKITIDWKGHTLSGQPNRWNSVIALDAAQLTLRDSSGNNAGGIDNQNTEAILVRGGSLTIESGTYASGVRIPSGTATVKISGGIFKNDASSAYPSAIDTDDSRYLAALMAPGHTLALDSDGTNLYDVYANKATPDHTTVYVVPHASHTFDASGKCACGAAVPIQVDNGTDSSYFGDFESAVNQAKTLPGSTVRLLEDVTHSGSSSIYIDSGTFTIDWNGHTLSGEMSNDLLVITDAAKVTLTDSVGTGGLRNVGGAAIGAYVRSQGSLAIRGGVYSPQLWKGQYAYGSIQISGGEFQNPTDGGRYGALYCYTGALAELLAPGYTFAYEDDELFDVYSQGKPDAYRTVYVVEHQHEFEDGQCLCGYVCPHTEVDEEGDCTLCGKQFYVRGTYADGTTHYYGTLSDALADSGVTQAVMIRPYVPVCESWNGGDRSVTLDLNGIAVVVKSIQGGHLILRDSSGSDSILGMAEIQKDGQVTVESGSVYPQGETLSVSGKLTVTGGYVDSLTAMEGSTVSLSGGSFGKIVGGGVTLKELLAEDRYYAELDGETPKKYADTDTVIEQVSVVVCDHTSVRENKGTYFTTYTCNCGKVTYLLTVTVGESDKKYFGDYNTGFAYAAKSDGVVRFLELNGTIEVNAQGMVTIDMENRSYSAYGRSLVIKSGSTVKLVGQGAVMSKPEAGGGSGSSGTREYGEFIPVTVESGGTFVLPANNLNGEPNMAKPTQLTVQSGGTAELQGGSTQWTDVYGTLKISGGSHWYIHQYEMGQLNITGGQIQLLQIYGDLPQNALSGGSYVTISVMEFKSGETEKFRDVTFADFQKMLVSGKVFQKKQDQSYPNEAEKAPNYGTFNYSKELKNVNVTAAPFTGVQVVCQLGNTVHSGSVNTTYGAQEENFFLKARLLSPAAEDQSVTYQWYQVQDGSKTEVGKDATYTLNRSMNVGVYTYQVTASCNGYELTSDPFTVTVGKAPQTAEVEAYDETVSGKNDGYVTLKPQISAYEMRKPGEAFTACEGAGTKLPLPAGTYEIRMKETENYEASGIQTVTVRPGPKLTLTLPSPQTGYTLTASKTQLGWHEDVELSFQLNPVGAYKAADFGIWAEAGSEKTKLTLGNDGAVKLTAPEKDITITVTGVKTDNVAPQASIRGRLRKDSGYYVKWEGFQENPADDFVNGDFVISATDRVSGVADFWYYLSDKPLTLEELKGMNGAFWARPANQGKVSITEDGVYYLYAKALDKANNAGYACTGKLVKESNPPTFSGVENGKTYYVSQQMEIHDDGMPDWYMAEGSIGAVPNGGNENPIKLQLPNNGSSYTFTVGDRCGNEATITVYMKPLSDLTQPLDSILEDTIRKSDRATLDDVEATLKGLDVTYATEPEKKEINDALARIAQLRQVLDQVAAVEAQIAALPDSVEPYQQTVEDTQIKPARQAYSDLTDHQKTLVDSTKLDKLGKLEAQLNAWTITEGDGQTWFKGSWNPLSFTVNGQTRKFSKVLLDGKMYITATPSFLAVSGSTDEPFTLTLKPEFLQVSMEPGEHTLTVIYGENNSGTGTVTFTVEIPANYLDVTNKPEFDGKTTVTVDGAEYPIEEMNGTRYVNLPETGDLLTIYSFKDGTPAGSYTNYPTGMQVFRITRQEGGAKAEEITEFANLLNYAGCSIRLTGTKGIRMITGISENARTALTGAQGLAGYTLEEYGTVVMRGVGTPTLENSNSHNFAYKKGKADPVFARVGGMIQYTNVLVGFSLEDCKDMLTLRPYIKLKDTTTGETVTLYGGCVSRSIGYIAKQNANTYQPGTAGYKYVHEIIDAVYGKTEQGGETK